MDTSFKKKVSIWTIILFILKVTFIGFGGGNALMPVIKKEVTDKHNWLTEEEFDNVVIVTNMLPGASVIQTISYICIHLLGKVKGTLVTLIAILPHVLLAFGLFLLINKIPREYSTIISIGVLISIVAFLTQFGLRYITQSKNTLKTPIWISIFIFTLAFNLFVPAPYNLPVIAIFVVIGIYSIFYLYHKQKIHKLLAKKEEK
ncbi:chromate transporter [Mycoplasma corogypsi]|uniref:chromate transporter n=1 Tax=Mycoplasma corogypsi TaxID=2106 RepID=UPI00387333A0